MITCKLLTVWYTIRYGYKEVLQGVLITGHDLHYTGEVHSHEDMEDHWEMICERCGLVCGTDVAPDR